MSSSNENGGGGATLDTLSTPPTLPHDIIRFFPKTKDRIFEVCAPLYEAGLSLREIEEKIGFAKSSIRETLTARGLTLRNARKKPHAKNKSSERSRTPVMPYGYTWLEGKLVVEPREYKVAIKIMDLWHAGKSLTAIAEYLNNQKILTRMGKKWFHSSIRSIIKRHLNR